MKINVVQLFLKRSYDIDVSIDDAYIDSSEKAAKIFCQEIGNNNVEFSAMLSLDNTNKIINYFTVSIGDITAVKVSVSQILKAALLSNASKIYIAHNHPSGILEITSKDIDITKKIGYSTQLFSIELIDSLIVSQNDYISIRAHCKDL